jgi:hypothetical protein
VLLLVGAVSYAVVSSLGLLVPTVRETAAQLCRHAVVTAIPGADEEDLVEWHDGNYRRSVHFRFTGVVTRGDESYDVACEVSSPPGPDPRTFEVVELEVVPRG